MIKNDVQLIDLFDSPESFKEIIYNTGNCYYKYLDFDQASFDDYYKDSNGWWQQVSELGLSKKTPKNKITQHLEYRYATGNIAVKKVKRIIDSYYFNDKVYETLKEGELIRAGDCRLLGKNKKVEITNNSIGKPVVFRIFYRKININLVRHKDSL